MVFLIEDLYIILLKEEREYVPLKDYSKELSSGEHPIKVFKLEHEMMRFMSVEGHTEFEIVKI